MSIVVNQDLYQSAVNYLYSNVCKTPYIIVIVEGVQYAASNVSAAVDMTKNTVEFKGTATIPTGGSLSSIEFGFTDGTNICAKALYSLASYNMSVSNNTLLNISITITLTPKSV